MFRSNLDPWGQYTDAQVWEALEKTHIKDMVSEECSGAEFDKLHSGLLPDDAIAI